MSTTEIMGQLRSGVTWTYSSLALTMVAQLAVTSTTARLLGPEAFGVIAMASVILRLGQYAAQLGVGRALIQKPDIDDRDVRAAFTVSVVLGVAVGGLVFLSAPLARDFYHTNAVLPVVRALSLTFVALGFGSTAQAMLRRALRFRAAGVVYVAAYVIGYAGPVLILASRGYGVWSLVAGALGQTLLATLLSYLLTRHSLLPMFQARVYRRLVGFGSRVSLITVFEYLGSTVDSLVIGRFGTAVQLGLYNRAFALAGLPTYQLHAAVAKVLFPVLSRAQSELGAYRVALGKVNELMIKIILPVGVGMAVAAPEIVRLVLGPQWISATKVFAILSVGLAVNLLATLPGIALESLAVLRGKAIVQVAFVVVLGAALIGGAIASRSNLAVLAGVVAGANALRTLAFYYLAWRAGAYTRGSLLRLGGLAVACLAASSVLIGGVLILMRHLGWSPMARILIGVACGVVELLILFRRDGLRVIREFRAPKGIELETDGA